MIGKSIPEYILIRSCILFFQSIAPASIIYLAGSGFTQTWLISPWIALLTVPEAAFYTLVYLPRKRFLQRPAKNSPLPLNKAERKELFQRCAENICNGDSYPTGWFMSPEIKRENVEHWLLWALFSSDINDVQPEWKQELGEYISHIEQLLDRKLENGHVATTKSMRLTFDPVVMSHRPLLWYLIVGVVDAFTSAGLMILGFRHHDSSSWFSAFPFRPMTIFSKASAGPNLPYWFRPHRSTTKHPIVFLHGIGIGLYPYVMFFRDIIKQDPDVGIVLIENLPICMHMTSPLLAREAMVDNITNIIDSLQINKFVLASHSFGTVTAAHILRSPNLSSRVANTLLIDSIPILIHLPHVAYNFVYRAPKSANEWQLWWFASRDPDIARALARNFFWAENVLWKEELQGKTIAVVLSGSDQIVQSKEVWRYLTGEEETKPSWTSSDNQLTVLFCDGLDHAMVFDSAERRKPVLELLDKFTSIDDIASVNTTHDLVNIA